jgi:uncharacterized membrane protein YphA (DoxX/SURF4 family)
MKDKRIESAYWALRVVFGVIPIAAGLDKFANLLTNWEQYLSPLAVRILPISPGHFMRVAGIVEIVVGAAILLGYARVFAWVATVWLAAIALNLITSGHFLDVAARDVAMAVSAFALARLAPLHEPVSAHDTGKPEMHAPAHT